ncbi:unnamed protein product, partial [marine sediment metagenome]
MTTNMNIEVIRCPQVNAFHVLSPDAAVWTPAGATPPDTNIELPADCWSEVLRFLPIYNRIRAARTNKEIYKCLRFTFTGQTINLEDCKNITNNGLACL